MKSKPYGFKDYFTKNVKKQIPNPAIFEWLGILDFNFVFSKFQREQKLGGENFLNRGHYDDDINNEADNAYLFED